MATHAIAAAGLVLFSLLPTGCRTEPARYETYPPAATQAEPLRIGDKVVFTSKTPEIPSGEQTIGNDGTLELPGGRKVMAAGKTHEQLADEITAVLNPGRRSRFYYVEGAVQHPGPQLYLGETDIVKAIASAGGLTEFARKSDIQLIRAGSSKVIHLYGKKALLIDPDPSDLPVYPGDKIVVPRR